MMGVTGFKQRIENVSRMLGLKMQLISIHSSFSLDGGIELVGLAGRFDNEESSATFWTSLPILDSELLDL